MGYMDDEESIGRLLRQTYRPVSSPPGVRGQIRERLIGIDSLRIDYLWLLHIPDLDMKFIA